jgi:hypothetical protein
MPISIEIFLPEESVVYTEGSANVTVINVRYSFANVVDIRIFFTDGTVYRFYQVPCKLITTP